MDRRSKSSHRYPLERWRRHACAHLCGAANRAEPGRYPSLFHDQPYRHSTSHDHAAGRVQVSDPVAQGFVANVTRPGGNLTGFSMYEFAIGNKWLDLLKEIAPGLARVGVMFNPDTSPQSKFFMRSIEAAAPSLGVQTSVIPVRATADIEPAFERFAHAPNGGLILPTDTFTNLRIELIADLAARHRLPSISAYDRFPHVGGLMHYGVEINSLAQFQQAASYVDRILKGAKPGDLPIQQADKYKLVINLKVAKALGLTVPLPLVGLADEVVE